MKDIKFYVNRFLTCPLPESVGSDTCVTKPGYPGRTGTNLLTAEEAEHVLRYVLEENDATNQLGTTVGSSQG